MTDFPRDDSDWKYPSDGAINMALAPVNKINDDCYGAEDVKGGAFGAITTASILAHARLIEETVLKLLEGDAQ